MRGGRRHRAGGLLAFLASVTLGLATSLSLSIVGCGDDYLVAEPGNAKGTEMNMAGKGQPVAPSASPMAQSTPTTSVVGGDDAVDHACDLRSELRLPGRRRDVRHPDDLAGVHVRPGRRRRPAAPPLDLPLVSAPG